jgi:hypothetical protein
MENGVASMISQRTVGFVTRFAPIGDLFYNVPAVLTIRDIHILHFTSHVLFNNKHQLSPVSEPPFARKLRKLLVVFFFLLLPIADLGYLWFKHSFRAGWTHAATRRLGGRLAIALK